MKVSRARLNSKGSMGEFRLLELTLEQTISKRQNERTLYIIPAMPDASRQHRSAPDRSPLNVQITHAPCDFSHVIVQNNQESFAALRLPELHDELKDRISARRLQQTLRRILAQLPHPFRLAAYRDDAGLGSHLLQSHIVNAVVADETKKPVTHIWANDPPIDIATLNPRTVPITR